jgi:hypothetical protein
VTIKALLAGQQPRDIARHQRLQRLGGILAGLGGETDLAHVRDVEQAGGGAGLGMLDQDAGRILNRHLVAGERHQAGAEFLMQFVEPRALEGAGGRFAQKSLRQSRVARRKDCAVRDPLCPET